MYNLNQHEMCCIENHLYNEDLIRVINQNYYKKTQKC